MGPGLHRHPTEAEAVEIARGELLLGKQEGPAHMLPDASLHTQACHTPSPAGSQGAFQKFSDISHCSLTSPLITRTSVAERPPLSGRAVGNSLGGETLKGEWVSQGDAGLGEKIRNSLVWGAVGYTTVPTWPRAWTEVRRLPEESGNCCLEKLLGRWGCRRPGRGGLPNRAESLGIPQVIPSDGSSAGKCFMRTWPVSRTLQGFSILPGPTGLLPTTSQPAPPPPSTAPQSP